MASRAADWRLGLSLSRAGRDGDLAPPAPAEMVGTPEGVEYRRGDLTEWYRNDRRGVEQGFTLTTPPPGAGPVVVELATRGPLHLGLAGVNQVVASLSDDTPVLHYDGLHAYDATGRALPARMALEGAVVSLRVDDGAAAYPLTIDPVIWSEQAKLAASGGGAADGQVGYSGAVPGDTAVVGAPYDDTTAGRDVGSAYVFVRSGGTWSQQARLTASDGAASDSFGWSVAISGDTAVVGVPYKDAIPLAEVGSAYVFVRSGGRWSEQAKLTVSDGGTHYDWFGYSVAVSGDTAWWGSLTTRTRSPTQAPPTCSCAPGQLVGAGQARPRVGERRRRLLRLVGGRLGRHRGGECAPPQRRGQARRGRRLRLRTLRGQLVRAGDARHSYPQPG